VQWVFFNRLDALSVIQLTVSKHCMKQKEVTQTSDKHLLSPSLVHLPPDSRGKGTKTHVPDKKNKGIHFN